MPAPVAGPAPRNNPAARTPSGASAGMVHGPAGPSRMGADGPGVVPADGEGPVRQIHVDEYRIGATTVTNAAYAEFVDATGYVTDAQRHGWSFVFAGLVGPAAGPGEFPIRNTGDDGHRTTAPARSDRAQRVRALQCLRQRLGVDGGPVFERADR
ncbi:SUMF1/EgtB/PvdO family nonheme iron enzyme [Micromonospora marina]|uniref:SUMF1/EgtB/PvdO family nonheme iron enzyme n=1 Tax=Micromonospora marina TaxID=307120 RepID=UPI003D75E00D